MTTTTVRYCVRETCTRRAAWRVSKYCQPHFAIARAARTNGRVPSGPTVAHIAALRARGWLCSDVALVAGLSPSAIRSLDAGEHAQVMVTTETAVLAIPLDLPVPDVDTAHRDATGFTRRVQALAVDGWSTAAVAAQIGVKAHRISDAMYKGRVSRALHAQVADLYEKLAGVPGTSVMAAARAKVNGCLPALAWDEGTIDDPNALPYAADDVEPDPDFVDEVAVARVMSGHGDSRTLTVAEKAFAARLMLAKGFTKNAIALLLHCSSWKVTQFELAA